MAGLAEAVQSAVGQPASVRIGMVDSLDPPVISAQGVPFEDVGFIDDYYPAVGDAVALLGQCSEAGSDPASWLALGRIVPGTPKTPPQAGQVLVTFVTLTNTFVDVVFAKPFQGVPSVVCTIGSNAGVTNGWIVRSGLTTATGFRLSLSTSGVAVSWTNVPVFWQAMERTQ
jgi:hypothetical protein